MAARAIWKGVLTFGKVEVPVKLYSAVESRTIRFRLLHRKDKQPIRQVMVNPEDDTVVPHSDIERAYRTESGAQVLISQDELEEVRPQPSRTIEVLNFLPHQAIDHRWYDRPYYLGPDGHEDAYSALTEALQDSGQEGLAHWVMRNKEYYGALRLYRGYPMLMALRFREEVVSSSELQAPRGKDLDTRELDMARQLVSMLEADFEPEDYQDDYQHRVEEMLEKKRKGGRIKHPARRQKKSSEDLSAALEASLKGAKRGK